MKTQSNPKHSLIRRSALSHVTPLSVLGMCLTGYAALAGDADTPGALAQLQLQQPNIFIVVLSLMVSAIGLAHAFGPYVKREMVRREILRRQRQLADVDEIPTSSLYGIPDIPLPEIPKHPLHPDNTEFFRRQNSHSAN